jgi:amino-acid N-acetyltransferase
MQDVAYLFATPDDADEIKIFLKRFKLPAGGIEPHLQNFIMVKCEDGLVGTLGLEIYDKLGVLRSFAVEPESRGLGIGQEMYGQMLEHVRSLGLTDLYLLTTSAELYFAKRGFEKVERKGTPPVLGKSIEFKSACMRLKLS